MAHFVSEFVITPVLRQARRFSAGFAANEDEDAANRPPAVGRRRTRSTGAAGPAGSAILEQDEHTRLPTEHAAVLDFSDTAEAPATGPAQEASSQVAGSLRRSSDGVRSEAENLNIAGSHSDAPPSANTVTDATGTSPRWPPFDAARSSPLPEDDGMGELRRKIQAIQLMDVPQTSKARMMHQLLTEKYTRSQQSPRRAQAAVRPVSPASSSTLDAPEPSEPFGPLQAFRKWNPLGDGSGPVNLPLTEEDLRPTYAPNRRPSDDTEWYLEEDPEEERERRLGCEHYRRNVKMQCASCERWYTCRLCHDAVEDHVLPRQQTKHMLCMLCGCAQKVADTCTKCGRSAAYYYCGICKLWNDDPNKPIYHCPDCDLCRVGQGLGKDFFHCKKCMACIAISGTGKHKCIERSTDCDCPICNEYMFNSPKPVIFMQCGHSIHRHCFEEHMKTSYKCPLCNKSCINMEYQFRNFDIAILNQPMPPEYADARAVISCNDCSAKSQTAFHWLGLKCAVCRSYNTVQLQLLNMPGDQSSQPQSQPQPQPQPLQQHPEQQQQQLQQQQQPTALNPDLPPDQPDQQQPPRRTHRGPELDREDITDPAPAPALPSTSPSSSYSPAFLFRLLYRTAAPSSAAPAPSPRTRGGEGDGGDWAAAAPISPRGGVRGGGRGRGSGSGGSVCSDEEEAEAHWEEEEDGDEDMLDLFGGRDRTFEWMTGFMSSTESAVGGDDDEDEEEEEEDDEAEGSEGEEGDDEDEDEEDDILLLGHR